jgi:hypothetical protein
MEMPSGSGYKNEHRDEDTQVLRHRAARDGELHVSAIGPDVKDMWLKRVKKITLAVGLHLDVTWDPDTKMIHAVPRDASS